MPGPGLAPIMPRPALFTNAGSAYPKFFTDGNRILEFPANVDPYSQGGNVETIVVYIILAVCLFVLLFHSLS